MTLDGKLVVDLWAGHRDRRKTRVWERDTLCCFFSLSKAVTTICVLQAVAEGILDLQAPVASYWPEFESNGKAKITIHHLLTHQAGLVGFHEPLSPTDFYEWEIVVSRLAEERTWWTPGEHHGYHARTFGWLLGEVLRGASGLTVSQWLISRISGPLALDVHMGLEDQQILRCADMLPARVRSGSAPPLSSAAKAMLADYSKLDTPTGAAFQNPSLGPGYMNSEQFRRLEQPAISGHGTARGVAEMFGRINELLPAELLTEATRIHSVGPDKVLKTLTSFGLGFMVHHEQAPIGIRSGSYGHAGAGGSMGFYDPARRIGFCYLMNQMQEGVVTGNVSAMQTAQSVYSSL